MPSVHFIYASTSGHTEHVIDTLINYWTKHAPKITVEKQRAEQTQAHDLLRGDYLILGSGTWNTGGIEGQLNMHMQALLEERAAGVDLQGKAVSSISLGDERYYFRTRCTEHLLRFIREHNGKPFVPPLVLVNEPYGQEERIQKWGDRILATIRNS
ncbi:MAG TPA: flavodoxin domain-containing protein [Candidatus Peribacteraceae bacterium]|nr:flavodoxin domain-containing protein [Candidatus Peribacteraceae bacterium]